MACTVAADKISFSQTNLNDDVTITVETEAEYTVSLSTADAAKFTISPEKVTATEAAAGAVTITLTAKDGTEIKAGDTVTVTVGGEDLASEKITDLTPTAGTGTSYTITFKIAQDAITGNVVVTVVPDPN